MAINGSSIRKNLIDSTHSHERKITGITQKMNELDEQSHTPLISNQSNSFYKQLFTSKRNSNEENVYTGTIGPEDDLEYDPRTP